MTNLKVNFSQPTTPTGAEVSAPEITQSVDALDHLTDEERMIVLGLRQCTLLDAAQKSDTCTICLEPLSELFSI